MTLSATIHNALAKIQLNPPSSVFGICSELKEYIDGSIRSYAIDDITGLDYCDSLNAAFEAWPKFSGDLIYPIPCPEGGQPMRAFMGSKRMWDAEDAYGALRLELLGFMVQYFGAKL